MEKRSAVQAYFCSSEKSTMCRRRDSSCCSPCLLASCMLAFFLSLSLSRLSFVLSTMRVATLNTRLVFYVYGSTSLGPGSYSASSSSGGGAGVCAGAKGRSFSLRGSTFNSAPKKSALQALDVLSAPGDKSRAELEQLARTMNTQTAAAKLASTGGGSGSSDSSEANVDGGSGTSKSHGLSEAEAEELVFEQRIRRKILYKPWSNQPGPGSYNTTQAFHETHKTPGKNIDENIQMSEQTPST